MCARSQTSGLSSGSTWRSSSASLRCATSANVRSRVCERASTIGSDIAVLVPSLSVRTARYRSVGLTPQSTLQRAGWRDRSARATLSGMHSNTFAARAGRWSAKHRKKAIWGWLAFVAVAFVVGNAIGTKKPSNDNDYIGQSGKADRLFDNHFPKHDDEQVLVQAPKGGKASDQAVRAAVSDAVAAVKSKPGVSDVKSPYAKGNEGQISKDGR